MCIKTFNVRGVRGKETIQTKVMKHNDVLGLSETWFNGEEIEGTAHISVTINQRAKNKDNRSFGGVALPIKSTMKHKTINNTAHSKYQFLTVPFTSFTITKCYISPSATANTTEGALNNVERHAGDKAIVMADLNAGYKEWHVMKNARGNAAKKWSVKHG